MIKEEILQYLKAHQEEFKSKYQISKIALFGSYARGENREDSDVDIAIETKLSDYFALYDFKETLENTFHTKVDVIRLRDKMNLSLKNRILSEGIYV
ncbi:MAG: nucleotidyltransferase domain-containing protein [Sulfuricurvum sp.]|nr:nucleotidyltransferase domain-containing protein [Sulfuricurvum sp.]MDP3466548.1 nucleotidyltransferase domain-containing protein [Sulfuricurvum sp.]